MLARMWRKRTTLPLLAGLQTGTITLEINLEVLRKLEIDLPEDLAISLLAIYPSIPCHRGMCSTMFIEAMFVIDRSWKQLISHDRRMLQKM